MSRANLTLQFLITSSALTEQFEVDFSLVQNQMPCLLIRLVTVNN